jgi:hypothetical protein
MLGEDPGLTTGIRGWILEYAATCMQAASSRDMAVTQLSLK